MLKSSPFIAALWLLALAISPVCGEEVSDTRRGSYRQEMHALERAIQEHFFDEAAGQYRLVVDPSRREVKEGYVREYSYLWSLCALYQAAHEIERIDPRADLTRPLLKVMAAYYDPAPPVPAYSDYLMHLKPGERYYDDNQWIGITSLDAFARTGEPEDLKRGKGMYDFMMGGCDLVLGGGIYWKETSKETKNTCSNGPGILLALQLYAATNDQRYLDTAVSLYEWTNEHLQAPNKLYYDKINTQNGQIDKTMFSYNTGTMLQSNLYLYECTGEAKYLAEANAIAESSLGYFYGRGRFRDGYWFSAVMLRAYQHLLRHNDDPKYLLAFKRCLDHALENDKTEQGLLRGGRGMHDLVAHGGMLEILARFAWLEKNTAVLGESAHDRGR